MEMSNETYLIVMKGLDRLEAEQRDKTFSPAVRSMGIGDYWLREADKTARAAHDVRVLKAHCDEPTLSFSQ